jgi:hypothetical protein
MLSGGLSQIISTTEMTWFSVFTQEFDGFVLPLKRRLIQRS